jgi:murein DD-endopeptidase MepM/ murein hydrolase activator NlpD
MVYATAPGVVTVASAQNDYGRLVEIDHGMGFKTRYAHLNKILVRVGQKVEYRDNIGLLGNSGRSTGPHLHYEIAHNGRPVDPMRFLKAGKYVYKGQ